MSTAASRTTETTTPQTADATAGGPTDRPDAAPRRTPALPFAAPAGVRDVGLLLARVLLGVILIAHGWQKVVTNGLGPTGEAFAGMGVPMPEFSAAFAGLVELGGGALLVLGLLTPLAGVLVALNLAGAWWFVHRGHGVFVDAQGWELVAALGLAAATFALVGPGRLSLDALIGRARRRAA